ncbi:MAG: hypothetical protein JO209_05295 [Acidisphaera sp.]|nr:hypothetical protein [Acidisphaera sp.]
MRIITATALLGLALTASVQAASLRAAPRDAKDCLGHQDALRVADTIGAPENCCHGQLRCAQYLATTKVVRGQPDPHT